MTRDPDDPSNAMFSEDAGPTVTIDSSRALSPADLRRGAEPIRAAGTGSSGPHGGIVPRNATVLLMGTALLLVGLGGFFMGRVTQDVSAAGQLSYACALLKKVQHAHTSPDEWKPVLEEGAYSDVSAAAGILSALVAFGTDREEIQDFGPFVTGLGRFDPQALTETVEATREVCRNR